MNRKNIFIISITFLILAIGGVVWYGKEKKITSDTTIHSTQPQSETTASESSPDFSAKNKVLPEFKTTGVQDIDGPYKKVTVSNGQITFSFEVPDEWLVETRNSGEVEMSEEELREFLGTSYSGDIRSKEVCTNQEVYDSNGKMTIEKFCGKPYSDYSGSDWDTLKDKTYQQLKDVFQGTSDRILPRFPNVSISSGQYIWYTDWNGHQIDIYVIDPGTAGKLMEQLKIQETKDIKSYDNPILKDMFRLKWFDRNISSRKAICAQHPLEVVDHKGKYEYVDEGFKGRPAGIDCFVTVNDSVALYINKQADLGDTYNEEYDRILSTMAIKE